jgi:thioredoxin
MVISITNENVQQEIKNYDGPIVLEVFATWCGPCQQMGPIFAELAQHLKGQYKFAKLNVDEAREISIEYGVSSVPTFIFINNKKVVGKETGYMSKEDLKEKIEHLLS